MGSVLLIIRVAVGLLVIKTGADMLQGKYIFSGFVEQAPFITGLFIILVGIHIVFASIFHR